MRLVLLAALMLALAGCGALSSSQRGSEAWNLRGTVVETGPDSFRVRHRNGQTFTVSHGRVTAFRYRGQAVSAFRLQNNTRVRVRAVPRDGVLIASEVTIF